MKSIFNKQNLEKAKTLVIVVMVTALVSFYFGARYESNQNTAKASAVKAAQSVK